uniref:Uncharacterized protein n=1 Tax=Magallana gigas TaxID=29159 RepID=K1PIN6_MAGGI
MPFTMSTYYLTGNIAFDRLIKEKTMAFRSGLSVAITACLLVNAIAYSAKHGTTLSKLTALQSLVFNNAQATVTLDSTALKQLVKLASNAPEKSLVITTNNITSIKMRVPSLLMTLGLVTILYCGCVVVQASSQCLSVCVNSSCRQECRTSGHAYGTCRRKYNCPSTKPKKPDIYSPYFTIELSKGLSFGSSDDGLSESWWNKYSGPRFQAAVACYLRHWSLVMTGITDLGLVSRGMSMTPKNDIQTTQGIAGYVPIVSKLGYRFCQP